MVGGVPAELVAHLRPVGDQPEGEHLAVLVVAELAVERFVAAGLPVAHGSGGCRSRRVGAAAGGLPRRATSTSRRAESRASCRKRSHGSLGQDAPAADFCKTSFPRGTVRHPEVRLPFVDQRLFFLINQRWTSPALDRLMAAASSFDVWLPFLLVARCCWWLGAAARGRGGCWSPSG